MTLKQHFGDHPFLFFIILREIDCADADGISVFISSELNLNLGRKTPGRR
jgi:hypothetical protein